MDERRIRFISKEKINGPVIYWMSRDQRVEDNWALIYAQNVAQKHEKPLLVVFCLQSKFLNALQRAFNFMLEGLRKVEQSLHDLNIPFIILVGAPEVLLTQFIEDHQIGMLITDFSPIRLKQTWIEGLKRDLKITFCEVDSHNIIPCWYCSHKKEYAAYTIRSKIRKLLPEFLVEFPKLKPHPYSWDNNNFDIKWGKLANCVNVEESNCQLDWIKSGEDEARKILDTFIKYKLKNYTRDRNDPNKEGVSNLSPYLHFGQIASQRVVLEAIKVKALSNLKGTFYDEIIVRKELSDNFCFYCKDYDNTDGFHPWARQTLNMHQKDKREYIYSLKAFEKAETHDELWNAAQIQMVKTGKMHGYLRMYWAKKILEWTASPDDAMKIAIYLNDKYELDGRDPNGYAGIAWSIGGIHDRAWNERNVFGKIRYMSYNGMKRKFKVQQYIEQYTNTNN
ncbi:MAG: deoxyribodipyrimidine photo-lyase [Promethearchaeota archaeon]|nr:MAG: deoxyribodipyrimidine photo-lyase [Candidatus Lokiarchaeota archaeon]